MAAFDFPSSPAMNQVYTANGVSYKWDGEKWTAISSGGGGGGAIVDVSDTPPGTPVDKQLWWESDTGYLFLRFNDGNSAQWVQVNAQPGSIGEAPLDGQQYGRQNGGWTVSTGGGGGGGIAEAPATGASYLRKGSTAAWDLGVPAAGGTFSGFVGFSAGTNTNAVNGSNYAAQANSNFVGLGGFTGFGASGGVYAISGYGSYGLYATVGQFTRLQCNDCAFNVPTTTSSPTGYLSTAGGLFRSTSQAAFKQQVEDLLPEYADKVLELKTIFYRPNELTVDPVDWSRFGFLTEDAYGIDFRFTSCSRLETPIVEQMPHPHEEEAAKGETIPVIVGYETGEEAPPSDIDLKAIVACLLDVVRRQGQRLAVLEAAHV